MCNSCSVPSPPHQLAVGCVTTCSGPGTADKRQTEEKGPLGPQFLLDCHRQANFSFTSSGFGAHSSCPDCHRAGTSSALCVSEVTGIMQGMPIVDSSLGVNQLLVPTAFPRPIFDAFRGLAHAGIRAARQLIASCLVWPCLASQVATWCRDCQQCQRAKVNRQPMALPSTLSTRFNRSAAFTLTW